MIRWLAGIAGGDDPLAGMIRWRGDADGDPLLLLLWDQHFWRAGVAVVIAGGVMESGCVPLWLLLLWDQHLWRGDGPLAG